MESRRIGGGGVAGERGIFIFIYFLFIFRPWKAVTLVAKAW